MIKSFKDILQTMFNAVVGSTLSDFNIGSVTRTVLEAVASAIEEAYMYLYKFVLKFFISTSEGEWLDRRLEDLGMTRKLGSMAFGIITIGRDAASPIGISIPVGTVFEADNGAQFATTELASLPVGGISVNVPARAVAKGSNANLAATVYFRLPPEGSRRRKNLSVSCRDPGPGRKAGNVMCAKRKSCRFSASWYRR